MTKYEIMHLGNTKNNNDQREVIELKNEEFLSFINIKVRWIDPINKKISVDKYFRIDKGDGDKSDIILIFIVGCD